MQAVTRVNAEQASKRTMRRPTRYCFIWWPPRSTQTIRISLRGDRELCTRLRNRFLLCLTLPTIAWPTLEARIGRAKRLFRLHVNYNPTFAFGKTASTTSETLRNF